MSGKVVRFTVSLEESLLEFVDKEMLPSGYVSRSELIRDLIREKMMSKKIVEGEEAIGVLSIIYDHHQRELSEKMTRLQHSKLVNIVCNLHVHLSHHDCLEVIIIKGKQEEIDRISTEIGGLKGVRYSSLSKMAEFESKDEHHHHDHPHHH